MNSAYYLCDNEACERHALVRDGGDGPRFVDGFQMLVPKVERAYLRPRGGLRLCRTCRPAYDMGSTWCRLRRWFLTRKPL